MHATTKGKSYARAEVEVFFSFFFFFANQTVPKDPHLKKILYCDVQDFFASR